MDQLEKAELFRALHERPEPLLLPNPWDPGTARLLAGLGFEALATTSLGVANMLGRRRATAEEVLDNCRAISAATPLPVNADLENGYADDPAGAAKMIENAYAAGVVGASIEDATGDPDAPVYDVGLAVDRVRARFGEEGWSCREAQPTASQQPIGGAFVNEHCEKDTATRHFVLDRELYRAPAQQLRDFTDATQFAILSKD